MGSPCGSLTRAGWLSSRLLLSVLLPFRGLARRLSRRGVQTTPGVCGDRLPPIPVIYGNQSAETHGASRGELRLLSAHDRRIYVVRSHDGYRTLSCVADSSRLPPASNPPALHLLGAGHTCTSTRAFASGLLQAHIAVKPLPSATLRLRQAGSGLCPADVSNCRTAPFSSRAMPGTHRDREEPHDSPLPHHAAYGSVLRGSADPRQVHIQGNNKPREEK
jgi:hypothetical protein